MTNYQEKAPTVPIRASVARSDYEKRDFENLLVYTINSRKKNP